MPLKSPYTEKKKIGAPMPVAFDAASIEAGIQSRRAQMLGAVNAGAIAGLGSKVGSYKIIAAAEAGLDTSAHRAQLTGWITAANGGDGEMFPLPCYARYLHKFNSRMSPSEAAEFKTALANQTHDLFAHGTLNHAVMRCTSYYLLAQYYPDITWKDKSAGTWTSAQVMATCKSNYLKRIARFTENGSHGEITSSTYSIVNLLCALNLVDFCADEELRAAALKEVVMMVSTLRANSHHGSIIAPIMRRNYEQLNAPDSPQTYTPSVGQHILWYYFGEPVTSNYELAGDKEPLFASFLASSSWRPPAAAYTMPPGEVALNVASFSQWDGATFTQLVSSSYVCDDFAIGCSNAIFDPSGYSGWQTFTINFKSTAPQNQISCYHPYWDSNSGEDNWTSTNRWSPFQQMYRYDDSSVIMLFNIPTADPWQYDSGNSYWMARNNQAAALFALAQYRIPLSADEIDTSDASGQWVFVRAGNTMIAIGTLNGTNEYPTGITGVSEKYKVVKIRQSRTAIFWRVESGTDFAAFKVRAKAKAPAFTDGRNPSCTFTEADGSVTTVTTNIGIVTALPGVWSACPIVVKNGVQLPRENQLGCTSDNALIGRGRIVVAGGGRAYSLINS